jgi:hypothetical protein
MTASSILHATIYYKFLFIFAWFRPRCFWCVWSERTYFKYIYQCSDLKSPVWERPKLAFTNHNSRDNTSASATLRLQCQSYYRIRNTKMDSIKRNRLKRLYIILKWCYTTILCKLVTSHTNNSHRYTPPNKPQLLIRCRESKPYCTTSLLRYPVKLKSSLCLIKHRTINTYESVEV